MSSEKDIKSLQLSPAIRDNIQLALERHIGVALTKKTHSKYTLFYEYLYVFDSKST